MTMIGIVGQFDDSRPEYTVRSSPCGNGKTNFIVKLLWEEYYQKQRLIITNFHTRFRGGSFSMPSWSKYMSAQEIFDHWFDPELTGAAIGITELQSILNSAGRSSKVITYIERCLQQRRKRNYDIFWDSQRWGSGDKRIRDATDFMYRPEKWHSEFNSEAGVYVPVERCPIDNCTDQHHQILIYQDYPKPSTIEDMLKPQMILNSWEVGELYDTFEEMKQTLVYNPAWDENLDS
jgi:hypothetical protein